MERDLTSAFRIVSSDLKVVEVDQAKGLLTAKWPGRSEFRVSLNDESFRAQMAVANRPADMKARFSRDVISILTSKSKGCIAPGATVERLPMNIGSGGTG